MSGKSRGSLALLLGAAALVAQLGGGTPLQKSTDQIERSMTRPMPQAPAAPAWRPGSVWVPDQSLRDPVDGKTIAVPGHWERVLPGGETYAPPMTICRDSTGCTTLPAGVRPAPQGAQTP